MLAFQFANPDGKVMKSMYQNPVEIIEAHTLDEVISCLEKVQLAVENGYYAAGYLSYESAPAFDKAFKVNGGTKLPLVWFGIYHEPTVQEINIDKDYSLTDWQPSVSRDEYNHAIKTIKERIELGDTYQVNYTIRMNSQFNGSSSSFYKELSKAQSANYSAYLDIGDYSIVSASPELFFQIKDRKITTKPMKGTIKRGRTLEEDCVNAKWLASSEKNQAENVMIVDLLRNDLGRIARTGTVKVPKLFEVEKYPTVYQMTSTVTAELKADTKLVDIFRALFPCGSITGAPKVKTMEVITELETSPREVYCGAIGYISPNGESVFNVPIRTAIIHNQTGFAQYGVGGGITWDSEAEDEYEEVLTKAKVLKTRSKGFELLESILLVDGELFLLDEHLNRMERSAMYFGFKFLKDKVRDRIVNESVNYPKGEYKVRVMADNQCNLSIEYHEIGRRSLQVEAILAKDPITTENTFLYHKTTNRTVYTEIKQKYPTYYDVLLWNEKGEITEFTTGNIVIELNGQLYTPSTECGLLEGTFREYLLKNGEIKETVITVNELKKSSNIWLINSVRKWIEIKLDGIDD